MRLPVRLHLALLVLPLVGCGGGSSADLPKTWPVKGKVVNKGQPLAGGAIEFRPAADKGLRASGDIGADGSFSLFTLVDSERLAGAAEGDYRVTVIPPMPENHQARLLNPPRTYTIRPQDNDLTIDVGTK